MKASPAIVLLLALPSHLFAATVAKEIAIDPSRVRIEIRDGLSRITVPGGGPGMQAGGPDLPELGVYLPLPPGMQPVRARLVELESVVLPGSHHLPEAGGTHPFDLGVSGGSPAGLLPDNPVLAVHGGRMRGRDLVAVAVAPVRWLPTTGELQLTTRFRVEVEIEPAPSSPGDFVPLRETPSGERAFESAYRGLVGGAPALPDRRLVAPEVNPGAPFAPGFRPSVDGSAVEMVIITTADQESEYQRLADFKTRTGLPAVVRTMEWIGANYPHGADLAETIRGFIRDAAAKWGTVWILLGGDSGRVPTRFAITTYQGGEDIPCDLYFSDLDGNWNADGDANFGEGALSPSNPGDAVDLFPDVWVGRLPSNDSAEAKVLVDKTLVYEKTPPLGYQRDILVLAEVLYPDDWNPGESIGFDGASLGDAVADSLLPQHHPVRLYENYTAWPGALPETKSAVVDSINAGFHLVQHVGHGFINTMSVGLGHLTLTNVDADGFTNGPEYCILYSLNCTSSAFDFNSIAERFLLNPNGGAVGSVGTTEVDYPTTATLYQQEFYHLLLRSGVNELGEALALSRVPYVASSLYDSPQRWTQFSLVYLGDPSLTFWLDVPGTLSVSHSSFMTLGASTFTVTVQRGGSPVSGARVALTKDGDAYAVGTTGGTGQATLSFRPDLAGSFTVGVWTGTDVPYLGSATAAAPFAAYLYPVSETVGDVTSPPISGNGDGRFDAGETATLKFSLKNMGIASAVGVSATLATTDPYLTLTDAGSAFPTVASGSTQLASDPMTVVIARNTPDRHEAHATLTVTTGAGSYARDVVLYIHAPILEYRSQAVRDTVGNGNGNGIISANEDFVILPQIRNVGLGKLRGALLRLRSTDPAVTITDSTATLGDVPYGCTAVNLADGLRARFSNVTSPHQLLLVVKDAYGEVFSRSLDLAAPATVGTLTARGRSSSIALSWNPVPDGDLWGYVIYRSTTSGGTYSRVNPWTVFRTSTFDDDGLPPFSRYYYRVAAIDSSGNRGALSGVLSATTTLPLHTGWPVETGTPTPAGVAVADIDELPGLEILGGGDEIYVLTSAAGEVVDGDGDSRTHGPITNTGGVRFWDTPAVGDVDGDGHAEVAAIGFDDGLLYLVDRFGQALPGWPKNANPLAVATPNPVGSVTLADIDADGDLEIFATVGRAILAWHHDGTELFNGDSNPATNGVLAITGTDYSYGTAAVANIDADPYRELIVGMRDGKLYVFRRNGTPYPGFPYSAGGDIVMGVAVGDIDQDGRPEIVFGSGNNKLYALRSDLTQAAGFPFSTLPLGEDWDSSPALGDVTGDGCPDVAIGTSDGRVYLLSGANGTVVPGWPVDLLDPVGTPVPTRSSPALADVDGNGSVDVVIGDRLGGLHAFNASGAYLAGFPIQTGNRIDGGPAVGDVDGDGLTEVIVQSEDQHLYVWDSPGTFDPDKAPWPMFMGNPRHTGFLGDAGYAGVVTGIDGAGPLPRLRQNVPNPFRASTVIRFSISEEEGPQPVTLRVYDLSGRLVRTLVDARLGPGPVESNWDGKDAGGRPAAAGFYAYRLQVGDRSLSRKMILLPR